MRTHTYTLYLIEHVFAATAVARHVFRGVFYPFSSLIRLYLLLVKFKLKGKLWQWSRCLCMYVCVCVLVSVQHFCRTI